MQHLLVELSQYTSISYTDRGNEIGAAPSIGTVGDSFDCQSVLVGPRLGPEVLTGAA